MKSLRLIVLFSLFFMSALSYAAPKSHVCFSPTQNCLQFIVKAIGQAKKSILLQAYDLNSAVITRALISAKHRGVKIKAILDKSQWAKLVHSSTRTLLNQGIPVWLDYLPLKADNNVIIIDGNTVITGSFDFSDKAQKHHAENLLIIKDKTLAKAFIANWKLRQKLSKPIYFQVEGLPERSLKNKATQRSGVGASPYSIYKIYIQMRN